MKNSLYDSTHLHECNIFQIKQQFMDSIFFYDSTHLHENKIKSFYDSAHLHTQTMSI